MMSIKEIYYFLEEYYGERVATDLCNCYDSTVLMEFIEFIKNGC